MNDKFYKNISFFQENGFLVIEDVFKKDEVNNLLNASLENISNLNDHERYRNILLKNKVFLSCIDKSIVLSYVLKILNHYNIQLLTSQLIYTPSHSTKRALGWHRDGGISTPLCAYGYPAMQYIKVGVFLTDLLEEKMGNLLVIPKSHFLSKKSIQEKYIMNNEIKVDPKNYTSINVKSGSIVIFGQNLWHATDFNLSNKDRVILYFGYGYSQLRPIDYTYYDKDFLKDCNKVQRQLLGDRGKSFKSFYSPLDSEVPLKEEFISLFGETWNSW